MKILTILNINKIADSGKQLISSAFNNVVTGRNEKSYWLEFIEHKTDTTSFIRHKLVIHRKIRRLQSNHSITEFVNAELVDVELVNGSIINMNSLRERKFEVALWCLKEHWFLTAHLIKMLTYDGYIPHIKLEPVIDNP
jgi:hypothetical protein